MIRTSIIAFLILFAFSSKAQGTGNIELFSKNGERFYVILNGQQMHETPETNVRLQALQPERYSLKIIFKDSSIGTIDKNVIVKEGYELTYQIRKNIFDQYAVKPYSQSELEGQASSSGGSDDDDDQGTDGQGSGTQASGTTQGGTQGISISVDVHSSDSSFSTSVKTRTSSSHTHSNTSMDMDHDTGSDDMGSGSSNDQGSQDEGPLPGYDGPTGCQGVMSDSRFEEAKSSIKDKAFADSQMTQAKQVARNNCLLTDQVKGIVELFSFEDDRLEFAKYAYSNTYDQGNYYKINDSFQFSSSIDELDSYLKKQ